MTQIARIQDFFEKSDLSLDPPHLRHLRLRALTGEAPFLHFFTARLEKLSAKGLLQASKHTKAKAGSLRFQEVQHVIKK
jgi:hypothetical protein